MKINTTRVEMVLMNRAIPANYLEKELGINRSTITRVRNGERKFENLTLETIMTIQKWIDDGNYTFSYDYSGLIEDLEADIAEGLTDDTSLLFVVIITKPWKSVRLLTIIIAKMKLKKETWLKS